MNSFDLSQRELAILYVIADYNIRQLERLKDFPREAWPSVAIPATVTILWGGAKNINQGVLNQFLVEHGIGEPIKSPELIYRPIRDKFRPGGLIYSPDVVPENQWAPTKAGLRLYNELKNKGRPSQWPDALPVSNGYANWQLARYPYMPAYEP